MFRPDILLPSIFTLAAIYYALLGLYAWKKRPAVAVVSFAWVMLSISFWSFTYGLEIIFPSLLAKLFFVFIEYIGIVSTPVFMFFFALEYTGRSHLLNTRIRTLIWIIPVATLLLVWTNPLHQFMWDRETVVVNYGLHLLSVRFGFFAWVHIVFSYGLMLLTGILLIMDFLQKPGVYRIHMGFAILGVMLPMLGSLLFITGNSPIQNVDFTPLFFLPTAFGLSWVSIRYRLLEILPPEHITMLKNMKDGVIVLNAQQRVLYINPVTENLFNRLEDDVIGQPFEYVSGDYHEKISPYLTGQEHKAEVTIREGSRVRTFEMTASPISSMNSPQAQEKSDIMITLHDITERKDAEVLLSRRESIMSAISLAAEQFLKEAAWGKKISDVLKKIGQAANVSRILVVKNDFASDGLILSSLVHEWTAPGIPSLLKNSEFKNVPIREAGFSRWVTAMSQGQAVYGLFRDLPEEEKRFMQAMGSQSFAAIPVLTHQEWWGFIMFEECGEEREWTGMELDAFRAAANMFGAAEIRARAEQKLIQRQQSLNLLQDIVSAALQAQDVKEMAEKVVDRLGELIDADGCFITLWDDTNQRAIPLAAYGEYKETYASTKVNPEEKTFTQSVLEVGHTMIIEDLETTPYAAQRIVRRFLSKSALILPLITRDKKLGAVLIAFDKKRHFKKEEIQFIEQASALISLALEKFQTMEETKRRADTSEALRKAGMAIAEKLEMDEAIDHILQQLHQVIAYDSASVQLLENDELVIIGGHGWTNESEVIGIRFPAQGDNPNRKVIESGKPYYLPNAPEVFEAFRHPPHDHIRSWLGVPLSTQNKTVGLLAIDSSEPNDFTDEDIKTASEFANQVAVALENARIFQEAQARAITDSLTGLYNRRGLFALGNVEFSKSIRANSPFSAIMLDLDHFKKINDTYGHPAGDLILCEFAKLCKKYIREIDWIGRYGGEEIVILLPDTNIKAGQMMAERLRKAIASTSIKLGDGTELNITASLGVASRDENTTNLDMLIARADQAMYMAKHNGRNRVAVSH